MRSQLTLTAAQQRIADLHRAAEHSRLVHSATTAISSRAGPAPRDTAAAPGSFLRWLRRQSCIHVPRRGL
jgi:hypothetical protein